MANDNATGTAEAYGPSIPGGSSFARLLLEGVDNNAHGPALISLYQKKDPLRALGIQSNQTAEHVDWTYYELQQAAGRLAAILHGYGIRKGSIVACFLWNSVEWIVLCWATAALNASFAPLDPRSINRPNELRHELDVLRVSVLVVHDLQDAKNVVETATEALQKVKLKIVCNEASGMDDWLSL